MVANDNKPSNAWLDFYADKPLFEKCSHYFPDLCARVKNGYSGIWGPKRENADQNFIWFMRFDMSFREQEIKERRKQIRAVP